MAVIFSTPLPNVSFIIDSGTRVLVWDSFDPVAEEYIRSCALTGYKRSDPEGFFRCEDFLHTGFNALSFASQVIINYVCQDRNTSR